MREMETKSRKLAHLANGDLCAAAEAFHEKVMAAYKAHRGETLFEVLRFPGQLVWLEEHVIRLEDLMKSAKHSLFITTHVLSCERLATAIKETAERGILVILLVDHTHTCPDRGLVSPSLC